MPNYVPVTEATKRVKKALQAAGYRNLSVTHGTGTAYGWIQVVIYGPKETREEYDKVYAITKKAAGREHLHDDIMTDYFIENISVDFREQRPAPRPRSEVTFTTKGGVQVLDDGYRSYQSGAMVRTTKIKVGDYTYIFSLTVWPQHPVGSVSYIRIDPRRPNYTPRMSKKIQWEPGRLIKYLRQKQPELAQTLQRLYGLNTGVF